MMTEPPRSTSRHPSKFVVALVIAAAALALDVGTKVWATERLSTNPISFADGAVRLIESRNPGAAFGMGGTLTPALTVIAMVALIAVIAVSYRTTSTYLSVALGLVAGGVAGNLADRVFRSPSPFRGQVVDWIDVGAWPTFNLADSSLVLGGLGIALLLGRKPTD